MIPVQPPPAVLRQAACLCCPAQLLWNPAAVVVGDLHSAWSCPELQLCAHVGVG